MFQGGRRASFLAMHQFSQLIKNKDTLGHLIRFFQGELSSVDAAEVPILLIDDEADNASIDTSSEDESPSRINGLIKELLALFPRKAYIGYTATPFANVLSIPKRMMIYFPTTSYPFWAGRITISAPRRCSVRLVIWKRKRRRRSRNN